MAPSAAATPSGAAEDTHASPIKTEFLKIAASVEDSDNGLFSKRQLEDVRRKLADPNISASDDVTWQLHEI